MDWKKNNKDMPDTLSLDNRFSNIVGTLSHKRGDNFNFNYNYSIDQNYKETHFNEVSMDYVNNSFNFSMDYLQEEKKSEPLVVAYIRMTSCFSSDFCEVMLCFN